LVWKSSAGLKSTATLQTCTCCARYAVLVYGLAGGAAESIRVIIIIGAIYGTRVLGQNRTGSTGASGIRPVGSWRAKFRGLKTGAVNPYTFWDLA
jgi:hypothetical protein